jgi:hypothetical protein
MPIIEQPTRGTPLSQGDILKGVTLYFSKRSANASWEAVTGKSEELCLVLSRQCVVEHKKTLTVASVEKYPGTPPISQDFKSALLFLENLRDGNKSPDVFYLGQLPNETGRFGARLDFLTTIEIPERPADRQVFIDRHRIATLQKDYVRDLHLRVFQAFASMGYEDYQWVSDADLKWLVSTGNAEISKYEADLESSAAAREAGGNPQGGEANKIADIKKKMEPYHKELQRRFPPPPAESAAEPIQEPGIL